MNHAGITNFESSDPAGWTTASYEHHPLEDIEPFELPVDSYREAAIRMILEEASR
jgi:hypothetical protein